MKLEEVHTIVSSVNGTDDREACPKRWYVAQVQMNTERRVEQQIKELGVETYLPLHAEIHQWSDRKKKVMRNLIPMMVFVHATPAELKTVQQLSRVYHMLTNPGERKPAIIPDDQMAKFRYMIGNADSEIAITPIRVLKGNTVRIARGQLKGLEGIATTSSDGRTSITILIEGLCAASVQVKLEDLEC